MTTVAAPAPAPAAVRSPPFKGRVTQARVIRSEWTKLWSLRSTRWSLLAAFIAMAASGRSSPPCR